MFVAHDITKLDCDTQQGKLGGQRRGRWGFIQMEVKEIQVMKKILLILAVEDGGGTLMRNVVSLRGLREAPG